MRAEKLRGTPDFQSEKTGSTPVGTASYFKPLLHSSEISEIVCMPASGKDLAAQSSSRGLNLQT